MARFQLPPHSGLHTRRQRRLRVDARWIYRVNRIEYSWEAPFPFTSTGRPEFIRANSLRVGALVEVKISNGVKSLTD